MGEEIDEITKNIGENTRMKGRGGRESNKRRKQQMKNERKRETREQTVNWEEIHEIARSIRESMK